LAAAAAAFRLGQTRYEDGRAALVLCIGYTLCGYHVDTIRTDGKLHLSLLFLIAPLLFTLAEQVARGALPRLRASVLAAFLMSASFATHAQYGAYLALAYLGAALYDGLRSSGELRIRLLRHVVESGIAAASLSAWLLVPTLFEADYLTLSIGDAGAKSFAPRDAFGHLLTMVTPIWRRPRFIAGYLGLVLPVLAVLGTLRRSEREGSPRALAYPRSLIVMALCALGLGQLRCDILIFVGATVLAADGFCVLSRRWRFPQLTALVSLLLLLDASFGLVKKNLKQHDASAHSRAQQQILASGVPGRVLTAYGHLATFWAGLEMVPSNASTPLGGVPQVATRSLGPTLAIVTHVEHEVIDRGQPLSDLSRDLLQLIGVRTVLAAGDLRPLEGRIVPPVMFAPRLVRSDSDPELAGLGTHARRAFARRRLPTESVLRWATQMRIDATRPAAESILVVDDALRESDQTAQVVNEAAPGAEPAFRTSQFVERHTRLSFQYSSDRSGFLRLAYSYAPFARAELDGRPVPFSRDVFGAVVVRAPRGSHRIDWSVGISLLRCWMLAISGLTLVVLAWSLRSPRLR